jgi:hypothetical protein
VPGRGRGSRRDEKAKAGIAVADKDADRGAGEKAKEHADSGRAGKSSRVLIGDWDLVRHDEIARWRRVVS